MEVEQLATQCIAPLNNDNLWITMGDSAQEGGSWEFGTATIQDSNTQGYVSGMARPANGMLKNTTMDTVVPGISTGTSDFVARIGATDLGVAGSYDSPLAHTMADRLTTNCPNFHGNGAAFLAIGSGIFINGVTDTTAATGGNGNHLFAWSCNGDGTLSGPIVTGKVRTICS